MEAGYQTYVWDDAEQKRVISTFPTEFKDRPMKPTYCFIGCPHNTYHEILTWGQSVTEAVEKRGLQTGAIPTVLFCPNPVRDRLVEEEPLLVGKMKRAGMRFSNMCQLSYAGMKGFSERVYAVTNSPKTRNYYPNVRYLPDDAGQVAIRHRQTAAHRIELFREAEHMWTIRFVLLGLLTAIEFGVLWLCRDRERFRAILENTSLNIAIVVLGHCLYYLMAVLPPAGGWNSRPDFLLHTNVQFGFLVVGLLLIGAGAFLCVAALKQRKAIGVQDVEEGLLTSGVYKRFRHPINTGILWITLGLAVAIRNPDGLLMFPAVFAMTFAGTIFEERSDMGWRFPDRYQQYRQSTRMFGPVWVWIALAITLSVIAGSGTTI